MNLDIQRKILVYLPEEDFVYAEVREIDEPVKIYTGVGLMGCVAAFKDTPPEKINGFDDYPELLGKKFRRLEEHPDYEAIRFDSVKVDVRMDFEKGSAIVDSVLIVGNVKLLTALRLKCIVRITAELHTGELRHHDRRADGAKAWAQEIFGTIRPPKPKLRPKPRPALKAKPNPLALAIRRVRYRG